MAAELPPAVLPLCPCGIRGCDLADEHARAFVVVPKRKRRSTRRPRRR